MPLRRSSEQSLSTTATSLRRYVLGLGGLDSAEALTLLEAIPSADLVRFERFVRRRALHRHWIEFTPELARKRARAGLAAAVALSMHGNGWVREAATRVLCLRAGEPVTFRWLGLRATDHVSEIAVLAHHELTARIAGGPSPFGHEGAVEPNDLLTMLPLVEGERFRTGRAADVQELVERRLLSAPATLIAGLQHSEVDVARLSAKLLCRSGRADHDILEIAIRVADPVVLRWVFDAFPAEHPNSEQVARRLLTCPHAAFRAGGYWRLLHRYTATDRAALIERALLDRSRSVRDVGRRAMSDDREVNEWYRRLEAVVDERVIVRGLSDHPESRDAERARAALDGPARRQAVGLLASLAEPADHLLFRRLVDRSSGADARAARRWYSTTGLLRDDIDDLWGAALASGDQVRIARVLQAAMWRIDRWVVLAMMLEAPPTVTQTRWAGFVSVFNAGLPRPPSPALSQRVIAAHASADPSTQRLPFVRLVMRQVERRAESEK